MTKNEDKKGGDKIKELALQIAAFTKEHERTDVLFACALMCTFILRKVSEREGPRGGIGSSRTIHGPDAVAAG